MYTQFFGMNEHPFSIVPNPHFLYMSERHSEALAHLNFGQGEHGGFVLLTGEVGTGKTMVSRHLIRQMPETTDLAFILNPALTEVELLATVCDELGITYDKQTLSLKELFDGISQRLLKNHQAGKHTVLLIDEAQHLSLAAMEQLRLLTNLETDARKLLQVILIGQPELQQMLKQTNLRQLAQRITARYHLLPLNLHETRFYIEHRLKVAGLCLPLFSPQAMSAVYAASEGVPRLINLICDRALMAAYGLGINQVEAHHVVTAASEILGLEQKAHNSPRWLWAAGVVMAMLLVLSLLPPGSIFYFVSGYDTQHPVAQSLDPVLDQLRVQSENEDLESKAQSDSEHLQAMNQTAQELENIALFDANKSMETKVLTNSASNMTEEAKEEQALDLDFLVAQARDKNQAYKNLFRIWGLDLALQQANCKMALKVELSCVHSESKIDDVLLTNSPAILEFSDEQGAWFAVLFEADSKLHLLVAEHVVSVSRDWLEQHWQGKASFFWQPPPYYIGQLMVGGKGKTVQWLESALAQLEGREARSISRFDQHLQTSVKAFQQENSLNDDGIAGMQTLIKLRQALNETLPRLVLPEHETETETET